MKKHQPDTYFTAEKQLMEKIPAPPYPGPPLESTVTPQSSPRRQCTNQEGGPYNHQQPPDPQNHRSFSAENIPAPPYPGPPQDPIGYGPQRSFTPQQAPQRQCSSQEGGPYKDPQNYRSLPAENMAVQPYPEWSGHQRSSSPQPPLRRQYPVSEETPFSDTQHSYGPQYNRSPSMKNTGVPPHPQDSLCTKSYQQEGYFAHQHSSPPPPQHLHQSFESPGPQRVMYKEAAGHQAAAYQHYEAQYSPQRGTNQATEYLNINTQKAEIHLCQNPANTQLTQAPAPMYVQNVWGGVQPAVRVVQSNATQMILPAQRPQVVIQPLTRTVIQPQPTVVIHNTAPTVRVIQPQVLPTVIQPASSSVVYQRYY